MHREFTTRAGLCLLASGQPAATGESPQEITAIFFNQSLPAGTEVSLIAKAPSIPGKIGSIEWQIDVPSSNFTAPPPGHGLTQTLSAHALPSVLSDLGNSYRDGLRIEAVAAQAGEQLSRIVGHTTGTAVPQVGIGYAALAIRLGQAGSISPT